jgi:hypothetical protein
MYFVTEHNTFGGENAWGLKYHSNFDVRRYMAREQLARPCSASISQNHTTNRYLLSCRYAVGGY